MGESKVASFALCAVVCMGCSDEPQDTPEDPCESSSDLCDRQGETRCVTTTAVQRCELAPEGGCLLWVAADSCDGRTDCQVLSVGESACVCDDECADEGPRACDGDAILSCMPDEDGCLFYATSRDCGDEDLICDDSSGTPQCVEFCQDRCSVEGSAECAGDYLMTCIMGPIGCLAVRAENCTEDDRVCDDSTGTARCAAP